MIKRNGFRKVVSILQVVVLVAISIGCIIYLINEGMYSYNKQKELDLVKELQEEMQIETESDFDDVNNTETEGEGDDLQEEKNANIEKRVLPEYQNLKKQYPDMYGRIRIEGISVKDVDFDFVVMYTPEVPNFYEDKNWKKEKGSVGTSVWIDGRTTKESKNTLIYGHNIKGGFVFGSLMSYKKKEFFESYKYIQFDTLYEKRTYEIIAVSGAMYDDKNQTVPDGYYNFYDHIDLDSPNEFKEYLKEAKKNSYFNIETNAEYGDELITLSTCDYSNYNRLIIVAKKV